MNYPYTVHTVPHNLSKEETIVQMVEILDHLNSITQDIFARVNKRIESNTEKLSSISKRIEVAASKVENLKGDKKAKTVFSSSKYPAVDTNRDYVSIFKEASSIERVRHDVQHNKYASTFEPLSKLQFYHVKVPDQKNTQTPQGLGSVPADTKCINDLLLFNTGKNVYRDFKPSDSLKRPEIVNNKEYCNTTELGAAPKSISERSAMQQASKDSYFYTPKIEELPALDVPWDLPDLPGIADDIRYEIEASSSIAPSAATTSHIEDLDLPDISEIKDIQDVAPPSPPHHEIPEPPPMLQLEVDIPKPAINIPEPPNDIPEPPPPATVTTLPPTDSRASLMDAIRKAGGSQKANLRKTSEQVPSASTSKTASSGDLMADLHSKLLMRRKGISGAKKEDQANVSDSAFARLSSIIPPPRKNSDVGSSVSTDDEAWNDDDD